MIVEADGDVRALIHIMVTRLAHEPIFDLEDTDDLDAIDLAIIEPAGAHGLATAERFYAAGIRLIFITTTPKPGPQLVAMQPVACLRKPFTRIELEASIRAALGDATNV